MLVSDTEQHEVLCVLMASSRNPRSEVLVASRRRSGSTTDDLENESVAVPKVALPTKNPDVNKQNMTSVGEAGLNNDRSRSNLNFGSKVSKMKELFQPLGGKEDGNIFGRTQPPEAEKSPEIKRKKISEQRMPRQEKRQIDPKGLLDATNHVQRFNFTRALFAKMDEQSRSSQDINRSRKASPRSGARTSSPSPVISPVGSTPTSPERKVSTFDYDSNAAGAEARRALSPVGQRDRKEVSTSFASGAIGNSDYLKPKTSNFHHDVIRTNNVVPNTSLPTQSNAPGGLLWKRRKPDSTSTRPGSTDREESPRDKDYVNGSSDPDLQHSNDNYDLSVQSGYRKDLPVSKENIPASVDKYRRRPTTEPPKVITASDVVLRRKRDDPPPSDESTYSAKSKRLSKQEIDAALQRADNYLSNKSKSNEQFDFQAKRRSWEVREQQDGTDPGFDWRKSKSRSYEALDDKTSNMNNRKFNSTSVSSDQMNNSFTNGATKSSTLPNDNRGQSLKTDPIIKSNIATSDTACVVNNSKLKTDTDTKGNDHISTSGSHQFKSKPPLPTKPSIASPVITPSVDKSTHAPKPSAHKPKPSIIASRAPIRQDTPVALPRKVPGKTSASPTPPARSCDSPADTSNLDIRSTSETPPSDAEPPPIPSSPPPELDVDDLTTVAAVQERLFSSRPPPPPYRAPEEPPPPYSTAVEQVRGRIPNPDDTSPNDSVVLKKTVNLQSSVPAPPGCSTNSINHQTIPVYQNVGGPSIYENVITPHGIGSPTPEDADSIRLVQF